MATAYNTTITVYKGVPLVKGGTDVLYLSAAAAEGVLASYAAGTYTGYYFERENRRYVQIDETYGNLDDVNYLSFKNMSHGGKLYFAFVDHCVYINDNNTELEFTIDPFPTFLGDTTTFDDVYVIRNTVIADTPRANLQPDYLPDSVKTEYNQLAIYEDTYYRPAVLFAGSRNYSYTDLTYAGVNTGLLLGAITPGLLQDIIDHGGVVISAFLIPNSVGQTSEMLVPLGNILAGDPLAHVSQYSYEKIKSGVYNQVVLQTPNGVKTYTLEDFANVHAVAFKALVCMIPSPTIYVYPADYRGVADNIAEGIAIQTPLLPISANVGYSEKQMNTDLYSGIVNAITGAIGGGIKGGAAGAIMGGLVGLGTGAINMAKNAAISKFNAPQTFISGPGLIASDNKLKIALSVASPTLTDFVRIKDYFDYFGYNLEAMKSSATVNLNDEAYLQTGCEFVHGSMADDELNARIMNGIKIRKTL